MLRLDFECNDTELAATNNHWNWSGIPLLMPYHWTDTPKPMPLDWYTKFHATDLIHHYPCNWTDTPLSMQLNWYCTCNHTMLAVTPITVKAYRTQPTNHIWHSWTPSTCRKCLPLVTWSRATIKTFLHQKFVPASFSQPSTPFSLQYPSNFNLPSTIQYHFSPCISSSAPLTAIAPLPSFENTSLSVSTIISAPIILEIASYTFA